MYVKRERCAETTKYRLIDTDFVAEFDGSENFDLSDPSDINPTTVYWERFVECYEQHAANIAGNLLLALKDMGWFDSAYGNDNLPKLRERLFTECKKLAAYRDQIERLMLLM
jgi:hypothetical protein